MFPSVEEINILEKKKKGLYINLRNLTTITKMHTWK